MSGFRKPQVNDPWIIVAAMFLLKFLEEKIIYWGGGDITTFLPTTLSWEFRRHLIRHVPVLFLNVHGAMKKGYTHPVSCTGLSSDMAFQPEGFKKKPVLNLRNPDFSSCEPILDYWPKPQFFLRRRGKKTKHLFILCKVLLDLFLCLKSGPKVRLNRSSPPNKRGRLLQVLQNLILAFFARSSLAVLVAHYYPQQMGILSLRKPHPGLIIRMEFGSQSCLKYLGM